MAFRFLVFQLNFGHLSSKSISLVRVRLFTSHYVAGLNCIVLKRLDSSLFTVCPLRTDCRSVCLDVRYRFFFRNSLFSIYILKSRETASRFSASHFGIFLCRITRLSFGLSGTLSSSVTAILEALAGKRRVDV